MPRYCRKQYKNDQLSANSKWADPNIALRTAGKREFTLFLRWCLKLRRGKNGRRLKRIKKASTLDTNWKMFLRHYEQVNGDPMDAKLCRRMRKVRMNLLFMICDLRLTLNRVSEGL